MCMPEQKATAPAPQPADAMPRPPTLVEPTKSAPHSAMTSMNMGEGGRSNEGAMVRVNQFMVYSHTSGPRGLSRVTGPGMWMLMFDKDLSTENHLSVDVMGTPEHLTVGDKGTPQLLQTENIDAMHPHDYVMALEVRDSLMLDAAANERLTFLLAPRGEAAIGPVPFMHRDSAEGNPDAPVSHALQDGFHDVSTVIGIGYQMGGTTVEATAFSGAEISWPLPLHRPDSYGFRINQGIGEHLGIGASYANAFLPDEAGGGTHNRFVAAWLTASYRISAGELKTSVIYGRGRAAHHSAQNSFLEEAVYQQGRNSFYNRAELLQLSPAELDIPSDDAKVRWVGAVTLGYERTVLDKAGFALLAGASYTRDFIPAAFEPAYGATPEGEKIYLRLAFHRAIH